MGTYNKQFCNKLHSLRRERDLSQQNMADLLGISLNGYAK